MSTAALSIWDDAEYAILHAAERPATIRVIADRSGLTPDITKAHLEVHRHEGLVVQIVDDGVRYKLTLAGWKRVFALAQNGSTGQAA